jgi:hypothetical protein
VAIQTGFLGHLLHIVALLVIAFAIDFLLSAFFSGQDAPPAPAFI